MSRLGGRPRRGEEAHTRQVRINDDLADMLGWIVRLTRVHSAVYLDPLIRDRITADYTPLIPEIRRIQALEAETAKAEAEAQRRVEDEARKRAAENPPAPPPDETPTKRRKK